MKLSIRKKTGYTCAAALVWGTGMSLTIWAKEIPLEIKLIVFVVTFGCYLYAITVWYPEIQAFIKKHETNELQPPQTPSKPH
jgi:hypothetical protein